MSIQIQDPTSSDRLGFRPHSFKQSRMENDIDIFADKDSVSSVSDDGRSGGVFREAKTCHKTKWGCHDIKHKKWNELDPSSDQAKRKFISSLSTKNGDLIRSKRLDVFLTDPSKVTVSYTRDGKIVLAGVESNIPNFVKDEKKKYEEKYAKDKKEECSFKDSLKNTMYANIAISFLLFVALVVIVALFLIVLVRWLWDKL